MTAKTETETEKKNNSKEYRHLPAGSYLKLWDIHT